MRTKTLLLSAVVGALSGASLMAQVYSLNAVGYINVTLPPGLSQIADQLYATNGQANYLSPTLDSQLGTNPGFVNCRIYKYVPATQNYDAYSITLGTQAQYQGGTGIPEKPIGSPLASTVTCNPGEAFWFYNAGTSNLTLTFVGTVPATNSTIAGLTNSLSSGLQMVSSVVPVSGQLDTVLGLTPQTGDTAYFYVPASQNYQGFKWAAGGFWKVVSGTAPEPVPQVGQGFWYIVNAPSTTNNWTQYFGVNE